MVDGHEAMQPVDLPGANERSLRMTTQKFGKPQHRPPRSRDRYLD